MRVAAIITVLFGLLVAAPAAAEQSRDSLEITDGRGVITVKGRGPLLGRLDRGTLTILDLTPNDQWSPRVNGIPRGKHVSMRGRDITFYVPAGRYRVVVRGEGINVSARGTGSAVLDGQPDATGTSGSYTLGDGAAQAVPDDKVRVTFGGGDSARVLRAAS